MGWTYFDLISYFVKSVCVYVLKLNMILKVKFESQVLVVVLVVKRCQSTLDLTWLDLNWLELNWVNFNPLMLMTICKCEFWILIQLNFWFKFNNDLHKMILLKDFFTWKLLFHIRKKILKIKIKNWRLWAEAIRFYVLWNMKSLKINFILQKKNWSIRWCWAELWIKPLEFKKLKRLFFVKFFFLK